MMMKHGAQTGFALDRICNAHRPLRKYAPPVIGHAMLWPNTPGILSSHRIAIGIVSQHNQSFWPAHLSKEPCCADSVRLTFAMAGGVVQVDADPRSQELQVARGQFLA